ncbi:MAG TPA: GTA-gp10 family protein [Rhizomicrobium sp.]|nr:GTA-gp10 family protein [Rhizomicrobium sp.]
MTNTARGDATLAAGNQSLVMRLTLGALSEIESALGNGGGLAGISGSLTNLASKDIALVASALLKGGGYEVSPAEVMKLETDVFTLVDAIAAAFNASGGGANAAGGTAAGTNVSAGAGAATGPLPGPSTGASSSSSASA